MKRPPFVSRAAQAGFTLIELMVSLVIGLVVVGALLAAYYASLTSGRHSEAVTQVAEDATLALSVIRNQVAQAGFSEVLSVTKPPATIQMVKHDFKAVRGCEGANFNSAQSANGAGVCAATAANAPDSIEVAYQAFAAQGSSAVLVGGVPVDCVGNTYAAIPDATPWYLNDSKFYVDVDKKTLYCSGSSSIGVATSTAAPLVDNVEDLQIRYGIASGGSNQITYYATANQLAGDPDWVNVAAISICVQVKSAEKVLASDTSDGSGNYYDCLDQQQSSTDGYLRRSFSTTVVLQNKML